MAATEAYASKPRPVAIIQDDAFDATDSVTVCPFTTTVRDAPYLRVPVVPTSGNGLREASHLMIDKITTVPRAWLGERVGRLSDEHMVKLGRNMMVFLGLAGSAGTDVRAGDED